MSYEKLLVGGILIERGVLTFHQIQGATRWKDLFLLNHCFRNDSGFYKVNLECKIINLHLVTIVRRSHISNESFRLNYGFAFSLIIVGFNSSNDQEACSTKCVYFV